MTAVLHWEGVNSDERGTAVCAVGLPGQKICLLEAEVKGKRKWNRKCSSGQARTCRHTLPTERIVSFILGINAILKME